MNDRKHGRTKTPRRPVDNAHLPPIFRLVGEYRNVIPVSDRDLSAMAARRRRIVLESSARPIDLHGEDGPPWDAA